MSTEFTSLPIVIDPLSEILEISMRVNNDWECWEQFQRVQLDVVRDNLEGLLPDNIYGFFAPMTDIDDPKLFLGYDGSGMLASVFVKEDKRWNVVGIPDEVVTRHPRLPSVRLVFEDDRARDVFTHVLKQIIDGTVVCPALQIPLSKVVGNPIQVLVAEKDDGKQFYDLRPVLWEPRANS